MFFAVVLSTVLQGATFEPFARLLGATTDEQALPAPLLEAGAVRRLGAEVVQFAVRPRDAVVGHPVRELGMPRDALLNLIVRDEQAIPPRGSTVVEAGDHLHVLVRQEVAMEFTALLRRWRQGPIAPRPQRPVGTRAVSIFSTGPWGADDGDPASPETVNGLPVIDHLRTRRDVPGALVALGDGRFAYTGPIKAIGSARQLQDAARKRLARSPPTPSRHGGARSSARSKANAERRVDFRLRTGVQSRAKGRTPEPLHRPTPRGEVLRMSTTIHDRDEQRLAEMGYKQELDRSWSGFQNFAISFTIISILAGCFTTYGQAWNNGGPIAISWGWPLISIPILIIGFCMSELVSAYPTAGGIYWWASKLGGPGWGWFTGWFNLIGLIAVTASVDYGCATFMNTTLGLFKVNLVQRRGDRQHVPARHVLAVHRDPRAARADQHPHAATSSRCSTAISVWWHVAGVAVIIAILIFVPVASRERRLRLHRAPQQLRASAAACSGSTCCRSASC